MLPGLVKELFPQFRLKNRRKYTSGIGGDPSTRVRPIEDTLTEIIPICRDIGVTRVSDITFMDRLGIPNYSAVLPGTEDGIWVYSGKGTTKTHAKVSALMEAIERYSSLFSSYPRPLIQGTYSELSKSYKRVLHPDEVVEAVNPQFNDRDTILDFVPGFDLLPKENILVPAEIALYCYCPKFPAIPVFSHFHTNGLASGNVLEEAICHALCEVIERDAVSIAELCASCIPYNILEKIIDSLEKHEKIDLSDTRIQIERKFTDDPNIFPVVDISEICNEDGPVKRLTTKFAQAGIPLLIKNITQRDIGIPTFVASSVEWINDSYGYCVRGYGTHPDSRMALIRAITEASQSRAANIQGARDDLKKINYNQTDEIDKRKWEFMPSCLGPNESNYTNMIKFSEIDTFVSGDVLEDINFILKGLKGAGIKKAIIVDLTSPNIKVPVVRAIVPGLESFEATSSVMGERATNYFIKLRTHHQK